jgi:predicted nucleic acid-binding protein
VFDLNQANGYNKAMAEPTSLKCAVSNTGPMLSVFQSEQVTLLKFLYDRIYIPASTLAEFMKHGAGALIQELIETGFVVVCELSETEKDTARRISEEIATHPLTKDKVARNHYPEAEAMVLTSRMELQAPEILLDEQAAREVAGLHKLSVIGFPGLLIRACKAGQMTPEDARDILLKCASLGTHYANHFIESIYQRLKEEIK